LDERQKPLGRLRRELVRQNREKSYLDLLRRSFNPQTVNGLMCRLQISVGWDGTIYDSDFNLTLGLPVNHGAPDDISIFRPNLSLHGSNSRRKTVLYL